eukprot:3688701-Amphidinium_carterae.1
MAPLADCAGWGSVQSLSVHPGTCQVATSGSFERAGPLVHITTIEVNEEQSLHFKRHKVARKCSFITRARVFCVVAERIRALAT